MNHWLLVTAPCNYGPCVDRAQWATLDSSRLDPVMPGDRFVFYVKSGSGLKRAVAPGGDHHSPGLMAGAYGTVLGTRRVDRTPYWDRDYPWILSLDIDSAPWKLVDLRRFLGADATAYGRSLQGDYLRRISQSQFEQWTGSTVAATRVHTKASRTFRRSTPVVPPRPVDPSTAPKPLGSRPSSRPRVVENELLPAPEQVELESEELAGLLAALHELHGQKGFARLELWRHLCGYTADQVVPMLDAKLMKTRLGAAEALAKSGKKSLSMVLPALVDAASCTSTRHSRTNLRLNEAALRTLLVLARRMPEACVAALPSDKGDACRAVVLAAIAEVILDTRVEAPVSAYSSPATAAEDAVVIEPETRRAGPVSLQAVRSTVDALFGDIEHDRVRAETDLARGGEPRCVALIVSRIVEGQEVTEQCRQVLRRYIFASAQLREAASRAESPLREALGALAKEVTPGGSNSYRPDEWREQL